MNDPAQQRYRVIERLAAGGMAEVFIAESAGIEGFKKRVAIKRVLPQLSEKKRFIAMFLDEARLSALLSHSNVAQVFDIGVGENAYFIVMEYVDGADLKAVIESRRGAGRPFPIEHACFIAAELCQGLAYAHELTSPEGTPLCIVHRDMSPPNVLITKHGEVKIVDFGLAKATTQLEKSEAGIIKGKYSYLSPEAIDGHEVDARADVFALGIILWEMLTGRRLFLGDTDLDTVRQVQQAVVPKLRSIRPDIPDELDRLVARALARDPERRYQSARDLGRDLVAFLFKFGKPVSEHDVAELVRGAMQLRKHTPEPHVSVIDQLIDEALFAFTSIDRKDDDARSLRPPSRVAFEDVATWTDSLLGPASTFGVAHAVAAGAAAQAAADASLRMATAELGNLAALEDDGFVAPRPRLTPMPRAITSVSPGSLEPSNAPLRAPSVAPPPPAPDDAAPAAPEAVPAPAPTSPSRAPAAQSAAGSPPSPAEPPAPQPPPTSQAPLATTAQAGEVAAPPGKMRAALLAAVLVVLLVAGGVAAYAAGLLK
jgi:serine/threonine protein kinase